MPYAGLPAAQMRRCAKSVFNAHPIPSAELWREEIALLWQQAAVCEERYAAIELFNLPRYKKRFLDARALPLLEQMIVDGGRWDYVDPLATAVLGSLLRPDVALRKRVISDWAQRENLWLRRSAILAQLKYKTDTDVELLSIAIQASMSDTNFFARKAIGWALREYTRTDPEFVLQFVGTWRSSLSNLSKREALRLLKQAGRVSDDF